MKHSRHLGASVDDLFAVQQVNTSSNQQADSTSYKKTTSLKKKSLDFAGQLMKVVSSGAASCEAARAEIPGMVEQPCPLPSASSPAFFLLPNPAADTYRAKSTEKPPPSPFPLIFSLHCCFNDQRQTATLPPAYTL
ncbi:hypothetical protein Bbelb_213300 [Branchiostoma belcheri]|nr:hypothetical protein Bbelb_213300 [Branchiostoma belcheri]